jgi:hypothetical protein
MTQEGCEEIFERSKEPHMRKKKWIAIAIFAPIGIALFCWIGGELVMHLWNWQAVGLLALCRILFGGWSGHHGPRSNMRQRIRQRMDERWEKMTPEEREKFRQSWRSRCGGFGAPAGETPTGGTKEPA